jgi:hypothetical protein
MYSSLPVQHFWREMIDLIFIDFQWDFHYYDKCFRMNSCLTFSLEEEEDKLIQFIFKIYFQCGSFSNLLLLSVL